ncbi:MAG: D-alanyl-D-alanine carboxypeptidase/D-alanyl-D-alanine-endopeptidase [Rhodothermales bacterium]
MNLRFSAAMRLTALFVLVGLFNGGAVAPASLSDQIERLVNDPSVNAAIWGVYVRDLSSGRVVYTQNSDKTLMPASNQKLLTTATALDVLGPDYTYTTSLHLLGDIEAGVLKGDLILEGSGDPTFASSEFRGNNPMQTWARGLSAQGVTRIQGRIIGDDNIFDESPYPEGWDVGYIATESFAPAVSGISALDNTVVVQIQSGRVGEAPIINAKPGGYLDIRNQASTSARRRGQSIQVHRTLGTERVLLDGSVPRTYRRSVTIPVSNPTLLALHSFKQELEAVGIAVDVVLVDIDDLERPIDYRRAQELFTYQSPPLSEIMMHINKESNNFYAEQLFRTFGWGGSTDGAEKRVKEFLRKSGIPMNGVSARDGSGLSRKDMVTPETIGELLAYMNRHPQRDTFFRSLARGGEAETTLDYRLRGEPVWAKTGSLEYVRALSGYAQTPDGRLVAFSLIANNYTVPSYRIMQTMDRVVLAITRSEDA